MAAGFSSTDRVPRVSSLSAEATVWIKLGTGEGCGGARGLASCHVLGCESAPLMPVLNGQCQAQILSPWLPSPSPWDPGPALNSDFHQCHSGKLNGLTDKEQRDLK